MQKVLEVRPMHLKGVPNEKMDKDDEKRKKQDK